MAITLGGMLLEARNILNDATPPTGTTRYTDSELIAAFNDAMLQARSKRPDVFLAMGLRNTVPQYAMPNDNTTVFPLDTIYYPAFLMYVVGRAELKEDTFADNNRAVTLMNKFLGQLMTVQA